MTFQIIYIEKCDQCERHANELSQIMFPTYHYCIKCEEHQCCECFEIGYDSYDYSAPRNMLYCAMCQYCPSSDSVEPA